MSLERCRREEEARTAELKQRLVENNIYAGWVCQSKLQSFGLCSKNQMFFLLMLPKTCTTLLQKNIIIQKIKIVLENHVIFPPVPTVFCVLFQATARATWRWRRSAGRCPRARSAGSCWPTTATGHDELPMGPVPTEKFSSWKRLKKIGLKDFRSWFFQDQVFLA